MTKKRTKSVTERINELINKLDEVPPPGAHFLKGKLSHISELVEALEEGAGIREAETKIENLELQLQTVNTEVERFRAEQKEREKKDDDLPDILFEILKALPSKSQRRVRGGEIAQHLGIDVGDVDLYLEKLDGLGYATPVGHFWQRTNKANAFILAKRLATEGQTDSEDDQSLDDPDELPES